MFYSFPSFPSVVILFLPSGPTAIFRAVISVIVDSINAVIGRRPRTDIGIEILERIKPTLADRNPTATVVFKARIFRIGASLDHMLPRAVFRCSAHAMRSKACAYSFPIKAPATFSVSVSNIGTTCDYFLPAVTKAVPNCYPILDMREFYHKQPSESLPRYVLESWGSFAINRISHKLTPVWFEVRSHFQVVTGDGIA